MLGCKEVKESLRPGSRFGGEQGPRLLCLRRIRLAILHHHDYNSSWEIRCLVVSTGVREQSSARGANVQFCTVYAKNGHAEH